MERAIETRRLKLLRLLAGWLAVVAFLSAAPIAPAWTRWVRAFLASVLERAEAAGQCLVFIEARRIAREHGGEVDRAWLSHQQSEVLLTRDVNEPPSLAVLRRRLIALRCLLEALPRRGLRLVQRMAARCDTDDGLHMPAPAPTPTPRAMARLDGDPAVGQWRPQGPWHPPETGFHFRIL